MDTIAPEAAAEAVITADGVMAVIGAAKEDPDCLKMEYSSSSKLTSGLATDVTLPGGHTMSVDEPETMPGGANKGPNPLDVMCGSLGTCQEITYKMYATVMGVDLKSVSCKVEGDIDLRGLVGLADDRVGFSAIRGEITIDSEATDEQLDQLKAAVDAHCPLVATLTKPCAVSTTLKTVQNDAEERLASDICTAEGISAVITAGKEDEAALVSKYTSTSELAGNGLDTKLQMPLGHELTIDEPASMPGGNNKGPNPLDLFCASFGTCQEITYKMYGTVMGIPINSVSAEVKAPCDLRGLVGALATR